MEDEEQPEDELITEEKWSEYFREMELERGDPISVEPRQIAVAPTYYERRNVRTKFGPETRLTHLGHHMPLSPDSWVTVAPDPNRTSSPSYFLGEFEELDETAFGHLEAMLAVDDPTYVREQAEGKDIVRYSLLEGGYMERTVLRGIQGQPGVYEVVSTYDRIRVPIPRNEQRLQLRVLLDSGENMPKRDISIGTDWLNQNLHHPRAGDVRDWLRLMTNISSANLVGFEFKDWLGTRTQPEPDMVEWVALYGYVRLKLEGWKRPIDLSESETVRWRQGGYLLSLDDFRGALARAAGGFLKNTGREPKLSSDLIQRQLNADVATLIRVVNLPLERDYTPKYMEWQVREWLVSQGVPAGPELDDAVLDIMHEEDYYNEISRISQPFKLRDRLESFEWGFEKLRMYAISEHSPEVGLPNRALFDELSRIDLTVLIRRLELTDEPLKRILEHLNKYKCRAMEDPFAPKSFWWRHYWADKKKEARSRRG